jgi:hypothetical protein
VPIPIPCKDCAKKDTCEFYGINYESCDEYVEMETKEFKGNPTVFVSSHGNVVEVTTDEHMRNANRPLESILREICQQVEEYAKSILPNYNYPNGKWYPCGSADIVLRWNEHRDIINLFRKQADKVDGDFYHGWFGRLFKTSNGWWWMPNIPESQSMLYEEEVCRFIRQKLALANIKVDIRTYID